jgi:putative addiction module component (TIGR02574 family)
MRPQIDNFGQMPLAERLLLVEDLWDSIARSCEADLPMPDWQKEELKRRKQKYIQSPNSAIPWPEVKRSILESKE